MKTVAHTPGPWEYERMLLTKASKDRRSGFVVNGPLPQDALELPVRVCDLRVPAGMDGFAEGEANARLIAAAPELLAACEVAQDALMAALPHADRIRDILLPALRESQAAIEKATGGAA